MSDFVAFSEDIASGMEYMEHFGILGQKHGQRNGPPYPLGSGDHSSAEKQAAASAGVKVGSDSGEGSIENVKKKKSTRSKSAKKPLTPEEKREQALAAVRSGDKKKIAKYMDYLSTDELRDAQARSQMKDSLSRRDPEDMTKSEKDKMNAILSGDKETVREYASKMTADELRNAMNKVTLMESLNHVDPPPSAMDKLTKVMDTVDKARYNAERAINAYNVAAKVYNSMPDHEGKWPIIGGNNNGEQKKEKSDTDKAIEALAKNMSNDVKKQAKESIEAQYEKKLKEQKVAYKTQKKFEKFVEKQEKKNKKSSDDEEQNVTQPTPQPQQTQPVNRAPKLANVTFNTRPKEDVKYERKEGEGEDAKYYYAEKAPKVSNVKFNSKQTQEPTPEQKKLIDDYRKSDQQYMEKMKDLSTKKVSDYSDVSYDDIMDSYKDSMRTSYKQAEQRAKAYNDDIYSALDDWMRQY